LLAVVFNSIGKSCDVPMRAVNAASALEEATTVPGTKGLAAWAFPRLSGACFARCGTHYLRRAGKIATRS
jgi:hypothetical protein